MNKFQGIIKEDNTYKLVTVRKRRPNIIKKAGKKLIEKLSSLDKTDYFFISSYLILQSIVILMFLDNI